MKNENKRVGTSKPNFWDHKLLKILARYRYGGNRLP